MVGFLLLVFLSTEALAPQRAEGPGMPQHAPEPGGQEKHDRNELGKRRAARHKAFRPRNQRNEMWQAEPAAMMVAGKPEGREA